MNIEIVKLICMTIPVMLVSIVASVLIHETGHLLGGLISGYHFTLVTVLGLTLYSDYGQFKIRRTRISSPGQCTMYPRTLKQNPKVLILGGIIANMLTGITILTIGLFASSVRTMVYCICFGGINFAMGLLNAIPDSPTNDGSTYRDVRRGTEFAEIYNRLMMIYRELERGSSYKELPESLLDGPAIYNSTLAAELAFYRFCRIRDLCAGNPAENNRVRIELLKLSKFESNTGVLYREVFDSDKEQPDVRFGKENRGDAI